MNRLRLARTAEEIDAGVEEADRWLAARYYDEEVRRTRDAALNRRPDW